MGKIESNTPSIDHFWKCLWRHNVHIGEMKICGKFWENRLYTLENTEEGALYVPLIPGPRTSKIVQKQAPAILYWKLLTMFLLILLKDHYKGFLLPEYHCSKTCTNDSTATQR